MSARADLLARRAVLRARARRGEARAALALARSLERDPPRDHAAARRALQLAAEAGLAEAMATLGEMLRDGRGGARDLAGAVHWLQAGARRGHPGATAGL
ncbi:MAG TPA: SEL1-like repeat protein, partial [Anaeromyxobacter sp.]|nr:SEL1-like repeat protein [Anaeromyxobacter sp.]